MVSTAWPLSDHAYTYTSSSIALPSDCTIVPAIDASLLPRVNVRPVFEVSDVRSTSMADGSAYEEPGSR